ncbi:hypothetical protein AB0F72_02965 [Actinoplanes sp. NPDC023936]|uniref:hypothetical protein n=1 Tax=Actinoplanes sp. NPDC023936 TaxID=3154910 RepID=UPI0033F9B5F4
MTGAGFDGVDLDLLADYIGGALIGTPDDERIGALVAEDPVWREAYQRLAPGMATVGATLRDLPVEPMPGDLAARLDSLFVPAPVAVPDSSVTDSDAVGESSNSVPAKVVDLAEAQRERAAGARPRRRVRWVAPISVAAGVVIVAGFGLSQLAGDDATDSGASESTAGGAVPMIAMAPEIMQSGFDYDATTLSSPPATIGGSRTAQSAEASAHNDGLSAPDSGLSRLLDPGLLADCLEAITRENAGGELSVSSVDYASYTGVPALIVRFTAVNGGWAWAVGADCGTPGGDADALQKVPVR